MADVPDISDLLPGLVDHPLWEGTDDEFTAYMRESFGIPDGITTITISPKGSAGRSAVAITGRDLGAIVFGLRPNTSRQETHVQPMVVGPLCLNADVVARAHASDGWENTHAITGLMARHLPQDVAFNLLAPMYH